MANYPTGRGEGAVAAHPAWWTGHDPAVQLQHLWGEVSRLFDRMSLETAEAPRHWMPLAEEEDAGDAYVVRAELPGVPRERVTVELDGDELHVSGVLDASAGGGAGGALSRRRGAFSYGVRVPGDVDGEAIRATLADGVLTVVLPKSDRPARRRIDVGLTEG